ncbi:hypothetical protein L484_019957 [Morus notabilis]|uniref:Uncharacterized protein n=1 Tax=Morus notabilis TaxID=981085 RepID=W9QXC9_9ROSA|nr:hypothetical protein L484_019957 [Morus notabilis]
MARVPLICRPPKHADCTVTSRVVSEERRIGVELEATDGWTIERTMKKFMETQRVEFERSIDGICKLPTDSVGPGGSSYHSLEILIQDIR